MLSFRHTKQTSNNLVYATFKNEGLKKNFLKENYKNFQVVFLFFPHLIYLPQLIVDKKKISVIFKQKGKEIVNWHKNEGFPVVSKGKGWNYCISSLEYTLLTFLLLTVYHLFILRNNSKDCIDRNVLNLS